MTEHFNFLEYSDQTKFEREATGRIQLAGYSDEIMLYSSFDNTLDADYAISDVNGDTTGNPVNENFGVFGQHASFVNGGSITYNKLNFTTLIDEGSIKFRVKPGFYNGFARQDFVATTDPTIPGDTNYEFRVYVDSSLINGADTAVFLQTGDTMGDIWNAIYSEINGKGATAELLDANNIRIRVETEGDSILVTAPNDGNNLITLLGGIGSQEFPNPPITTAELFDLYNGSNNNSRITLKHKGGGDSLTAGNILLEMYNTTGNTKVNVDLGLWNVHYDTWYAFQFNWNKSIYQLFIDGALLGIGTTNFTRAHADNKFILQGDITDWYGLDELIIYNEYQHLADYTVETSALQRYSSNDPYIDIHFGDGFSESEVMDLNLLCSSGCRFVVKLGNTWYYYLNGAWRQSDASYSQSIAPAEMETKFSELIFNSSLELIIRVYFHSDGSTQVYIDKIEIVIVTGDSEAAIIRGTADLSTAVDLSTNYNVLITTNQGSGTVNCKAGAGDSTAVTLAEIKTAIDAASVPGLASAGDSDSYLVLQSITKGTGSYVSIASAAANDALAIIWGFAATDYGAAATGLVIDYSELYRWVRAKLGEPTIPCELTDEQIDDCIEMGVYWYNYWRNAEEEVYYTTLSGDNKTGYAIPSVIDPDLVMEIIIRPRFPFMYYQGREDLITNLYMQYLFQRFKAGYTTFLTDYYITMSTEADLNIILGTQTKFEIRSGKLFIHPDPGTGMSIGIRYRSTLSLEEISTNYWIRRYTLAESKLVLGNIRGTFSSGIPGGTEMITLNGPELIAQGEREKEQLMDEIKKMAEPTFLEFF